MIDIHHHIIPPFYKAALAQEFGVASNGNVLLPHWSVDGVRFPEWSTAASQQLMAQHKISAAMVSLSAPGVWFGNNKLAKKLARACNEYAAEMCRAHPQQFGSFATLPLPDIKASCQELDYALDKLHMDGVILLSNYQDMLLGNPHFHPLYQKLNDRGSVVFIHPTAPTVCCPDTAHLPQTMFEFVFDTSRTIIHLLTSGVFEQFPHIRFVIAHAGGVIPYLAGRIKLYEKLSPSSFKGQHKDTDFYLKRLYYDTAMCTSTTQLRCLIDYASCKQIVFGSDAPFMPPEAFSFLLDEAQTREFISDDQRQDILFKNTACLFPRFA